jgi:hypothetical protein
MRVVAQSGRTYRIVSPLVNSAPGISPHVWKAVDDRDSSKEFVAKQPNHHDEGSQKWSLFQHEVDMQNLFQTSPFIRQMTDFAPATDTRKPIMLLEAFEKSLWSARTRRSLTPEEIKWIMKAILLGIWTIHREGLVYSGKNPPFLEIFNAY